MGDQALTASTCTSKIPTTTTTDGICYGSTSHGDYLSLLYGDYLDNPHRKEYFETATTQSGYKKGWYRPTNENPELDTEQCKKYGDCSELDTMQCKRDGYVPATMKVYSTTVEVCSLEKHNCDSEEDDLRWNHDSEHQTCCTDRKGYPCNPSSKITDINGTSCTNDQYINKSTMTCTKLTDCGVHTYDTNSEERKKDYTKDRICETARTVAQCMRVYDVWYEEDEECSDSNFEEKDTCTAEQGRRPIPEDGRCVAPTIPSQCKHYFACLLYTSPSPRDRTRSRMPSSA